MFRSSAPFENQFRWEVDRWVFRFRQRGTPVEVTGLERDRLVARHIQRSKTIMRVWFGGIFAAAFLIGPAMKLVPSGILAAGYFGTSVLLMVGLRYWADQAVTLHLRKRLPIGEKLGFFGAWMMRAEVTPWPQLLFGCAVLVPASFTVVKLPDEFSGFEEWIAFGAVILAGLTVGFMVTVKLMIDWRERKRGEWREALNEARDLRVD